MKTYRGVGKAYVALLLLISTLVAVLLHCVTSNCAVYSMPSVYNTTTVDPLARMKDKLAAVAYLNEKRAENGAPSLQLIELNVAKWRVEYIVRTGYHSVYDLEGRHPNYWYTRLDGGFYGAAKEVFVWVRFPNSTSLNEVDILKAGIDEALSEYRGHMLNPCYNYVAIEKTHRYVRGWIYWYRVEYYVFWLVAKWMEWTSPPFYNDGRFTVEGYADPVMRPIAFVVYYSPYNGAPFIKNADGITAYNLGNVIYCKYLDPLSSCNNAPMPNGTAVASKMLDSGKWYVRIDVSVQFDKPGLYTFELIAQDLRDQNRKCPIMQYTVEVR